MLTSAIALIVAAACMLGELWHSRRNERQLVALGARESADPVYPLMRWAYPASFVVMAAEGILRSTSVMPTAAAGAIIFTAAKVLKYWAIATLGVRWSYRVLVLPHAPLITAGPYRFVRHPNYVAVIGELIGMALLTGARWTAPLAIVFFGWLLWRRIAAEERALQRLY